jgi:UDP-glucose:(heptosyl)LPS alpha-1,3-glucosyltransferase
MKIALVVHDFDPRVGQGRYAVELARRIARVHDVDVFANSFAVPPAGRIRHRRVRAWRRSALSTVATFLVHSEAALRRERYDLVHAQGVTCWGADIITAHICNAARGEALAARDRRARHFASAIAPLESRFYRQVRPKHVIAVSHLLADQIEQHYGWRRDISVIYHGTDTNRFRPAHDDAERFVQRLRYGCHAGDWVWLFIGEATKGLASVVRQLSHFPDAKLIVVTRSDVTALRVLADELGVRNRLTLLGPVNDPAAIYRAADVFVYPSTYDAFAMVVAEAMASALPVIVGPGIGASELIVDRNSGLICPPGDDRGLRDRLAWLRGDPARAARLGAAARRVAERHSWEGCAAATMDIYERVGQRS